MAIDEMTAAELVARIRATPGMVRKVRETYDNSQGNADCDAPETSEQYAWAQHDHAINAVADMLALTMGLALWPSIVSEAYSLLA